MFIIFCIYLYAFWTTDLKDFFFLIYTVFLFRTFTVLKIIFNIVMLPEMFFFSSFFALVILFLIKISVLI